jgi:hypothetical protein
MYFTFYLVKKTFIDGGNKTSKGGQHVPILDSDEEYLSIVALSIRYYDDEDRPSTNTTKFITRGNTAKEAIDGHKEFMEWWEKFLDKEAKGLYSDRQKLKNEHLIQSTAGYLVHGQINVHLVVLNRNGTHIRE